MDTYVARWVQLDWNTNEFCHWGSFGSFSDYFAGYLSPPWVPVHVLSTSSWPSQLACTFASCLMQIQTHFFVCFSKGIPHVQWRIMLCSLILCSLNSCSMLFLWHASFRRLLGSSCFFLLLLFHRYTGKLVGDIYCIQTNL